MQHRTIRAARESERGTTMVLALLLIATIAVLSMSLSVMLRGSRNEERGSRRQLEALYLCEAGVNRAVADLALGGEGNVGSTFAPQSLGGGSYWVAARDLGDGSTALLATGIENGVNMRLEVVVRREVQGSHLYGAFGDEGVTLDSNAKVDSYDSTAGDYASQEVNGSGSKTWANSNGHVGSNQDVGLRSNSGIYGNAIPGPSGSASLIGSSFVTGSTAPASEPQSLPAMVVPSFTSLGDLAVTAPVTVLSAGEYAYGETVIDGGSMLRIEGPATIVFDSLNLKSNGELWVDATNGPVEIYVRNDFIMNSNTIIAPLDYLPANLALNLVSDNVIDPGVDVDLDLLDTVDFDSNAKLYGTIYAPNAYVEINSNFELYGALVARRVHLDSNSKIHYDESLVNAGADASSTTFETLLWRVLGDN